MISLTSLAAKGESLLDQFGLDSLGEIPWETFPVALGLSALIGAAAGLVYAGLVGKKDRRGDKKS